MAKDSNALPARRRARMLELIAREGSVAVPELARQFKVSLDTVRRDLDFLASSGALVRSHGGAVRGAPGDRLTPLTERVQARHPEKAALAKACAALIDNGETVILNGGSTTLLVAMAMQRHHLTTILTNSMAIVSAAEPDQFAALHVLGGEYLASTRVTIGPLLFPNADRINVDTAIIGVRAINAERGIATGALAEASMLAEMMKLARRTIVVADSGKFDQRAFATIAPLNAIDILVSDAAPTGALAEAAGAADIAIITP